MARQDAGRSAGVGDTPVNGEAEAQARPLTVHERAVLDALVTAKGARTAAQLMASCGLAREDVMYALECLRTKGLATKFNTLVESYAARFPGVEV